MQTQNNDRPLSEHQIALEQRAETEAMFMSIADGFIATDEYGKITRVNPEALRILGYKETELVGEWFPHKIIAVTRDNKPVLLIDRPMARAFLTGSPIVEKSHYRRVDGSLVPVHISVSPIILDGKPIGAIEVFRDITLDEEIDRMKSEFISLASHQLRTPLSSIKTYSHMLVDGYMGDITGDQKQALKTIIGASNRMNELISTLLNITRMESGAIAIAPKMVDIEKLIGEVLQELTFIAEEKNINVDFKRTGRGSSKLKTDPFILKEVLTNLISNAIKYTPDKGNVNINAVLRSKDVEISVIDDGWGIPQHVQDQVFSKFFRAQNISKRETNGTGLGLYLVKGLLEQIDGKIWFDSAESRGTSFHFTLPRQINKSVVRLNAKKK